MADLATLFPEPNVDLLTGLLGHDGEEASAWWLGADLCGLTPATAQTLLLARRLAQGSRIVGDEVETAFSAVAAYLLPVASEISEIDALHERLSFWLKGMLIESLRNWRMAGANAAIARLDDKTLSEDAVRRCIEIIRETTFEVEFRDHLCSVSVVADSQGRHVVAIMACSRDGDGDDCVQIGELPFISDDGDDGRGGRSVTPTAPVPLSA